MKATREAEREAAEGCTCGPMRPCPLHDGDEFDDLIAEFKRCASECQAKADRTFDPMVNAEAQAMAEAYRHAAELVRQAREGR